MSDGSVWCWGDNYQGQLGVGSPTGFGEPGYHVPGSSTVPLRATVLTDAVAVEAGYQHTCALTATGAVYCWGYNAYMQVSDVGGLYNVWVPFPMKRLGSSIRVGIAAGGDHSASVSSTGGAGCWGRESPSFGDEPCSLSVSGATGVATGMDHACALLATGAVRCAGNNTGGALGDGTWSNYGGTHPEVIGLTGGAQQIVAGYGWTCALMGDHTVRCWGQGPGGDHTTAVPIGLSGVERLVGGQWGLGWELQDGSLGGTLAGYPQGIGDAAIGATHSCAVAPDGGVLCQGSNSKGQLGDGTTTASSTPVRVTGLP